MNYLTDKEIINKALGMWKNHLQTGRVDLNVSEARFFNRPVNEWDDMSEAEQQFIQRLEAMCREIIR